VEKTEINRNIILMGTKNRHDRARQVAQADKKLKGPSIQTPKKEPEQGYKQSKLNTIFESDSEDFLKDDILRTVCATVCGTNYAVYF